MPSEEADFVVLVTKMMFITRQDCFQAEAE